MGITSSRGVAGDSLDVDEIERRLQHRLGRVGQETAEPNQLEPLRARTLHRLPRELLIRGVVSSTGVASSDTTRSLPPATRPASHPRSYNR